jgi:hypothetical protein
VDNVLEGVNYTKLVDDIQKCARKLGQDDSLSETEVLVHSVLAATCAMSAATGYMIKKRRNKAAKPPVMPNTAAFNRQQAFLRNLSTKTKQRAGNTVAFLKNRVMNLKTKAAGVAQTLLSFSKSFVR